MWFYDMQADGWSLDDKRAPLLPENRLGPAPATPLTPAEALKNDLPDVLARWQNRAGTERDRRRTARSFVVPCAQIEAAGWDLSLNRYKETMRDGAVHRSPREILGTLFELEKEIAAGMKALDEMLQ